MMNLCADGFSAQLNFLKGEVLTVIDASIPDDRRCKAVKDLIHKAFADRVRYVTDDLAVTDGDSDDNIPLGRPLGGNLVAEV